MDIPNIISELQRTDIAIKDKNMLINALKELDSMIGMVKLKKSIVEQLFFILSNIKTKGIENATDGHVLHTIIYGPPGVGKTVVGYILARIWSSLGILNKAGKNTPSADPQQLKLAKDNIDLAVKTRALEEKIQRALTSSVVVSNKITELRSRLFAMRTRGRKAPSHPRDEMSMTMDKVFNDVQNACRISADLLNYNTMTINNLKMEQQSPQLINTTTILDFMKSSTLFKVVSRIDFVAEYVGQTAVKTKKLLDEYQGGVLFVDEAYSLYHGDRDSFGSEALTVVNQYMTEHSDSTVLIFAGYKDSMQNSIFKAQQGLIRRFGFTFEIEGYTPSELSQIFSKQLERDNWIIHFDPTAFFTDNYKYFPSFGGDTQRLLFQCKIVHSCHNWNKPANERIITADILELAFERYKHNMSLDLEKINTLNLYRKYEEDLIHEKMKEHNERLKNSELFEKYREYERKMMSDKIKEQEEKKKTDAKFEEPPSSMYL